MFTPTSHAGVASAGGQRQREEVRPALATASPERQAIIWHVWAAGSSIEPPLPTLTLATLAAGADPYQQATEASALQTRVRVVHRTLAARTATVLSIGTHRHLHPAEALAGLRAVFVKHSSATELTPCFTIASCSRPQVPSASSSLCAFSRGRCCCTFSCGAREEA